MRLIPHRDHPPFGVTALEAGITGLSDDWVTLRWRIEGAARLLVPPFKGKGRADNLWRTTCFELFVRPDVGSSYCEFNLSPSEQWAAYDFSSYRQGMTERPAGQDPVCTLRQGTGLAIFDAAIPRGALPPRPWHYGLCAVLEEQGGVKSYWALRHPEGPPDFHHGTCFVAPLPAPADR